MTRFVGSDVSKATLDWAETQGDAGSVPNDENGHLALIEPLNQHPPERIVMEATGGYELPAQLALYEAGLPVACVNARHVRSFAKALGRLAKTDALDAQVLAQFAQVVQPELRQPKQPSLLAEASHRRRQLIQIAHTRV